MNETFYSVYTKTANDVDVICYANLRSLIVRAHSSLPFVYLVIYVLLLPPS